MTNHVPLLANVEQIAVVHYSINLACCLESKKLNGWVTLKLSPREDRINDKLFRLILDASDLTVFGVIQGCPIPDCCPCQDDWLVNCCSNTAQLTYNVDEWCIKIEKNDVFNAKDFPEVITILYETKPQGSSLDWVPLGDNNEYCCYTYGSWINNRSLLPCQEPPEAMATWSSAICAQEPLLVLMSSQEQSSQPCSSSLDRRRFNHTSDILLPISTLTLGIGFWQHRQMRTCFRNLDSISLYHSNSLSHLFDSCMERLNSYLTEVVEILDQTLGQYPFKRLDLVVAPRSFDALGMASPNLILLSQSIFTCTIGSPLLSRVAHELAHMWFGLMIGPQDWTEEWLSEGFATFIEETIHSRLDKNDSEMAREKMEIRAYLKWKQMENECENVEESLTVLRPNHGEEIPVAVHGDVSGKLIVDGANPIKRTIQIHYLKGYFLLIYLKDLVGCENFFRFIRQLYEENKGTLITSNTVFTSYCSFFTEQLISLPIITADYLAKTWLDNSGLPEVPFPYDIERNRIYNKVQELLEPLAKASEQRQAKRKRAKLSIDLDFEPMEEESLKLLLEKCLTLDHLPKKTLVCLRDSYQLSERNAEIRHSWCELVVKHKFKQDYPIVTKFLQEEQAMGVYLYGELLYSESRTQKALGREIFSSIQHEMNRNFKAVVLDMISNVERS